MADPELRLQLNELMGPRVEAGIRQEHSLLPHSCRDCRENIRMVFFSSKKKKKYSFLFKDIVLTQSQYFLSRYFMDVYCISRFGSNYVYFLRLD